MLAASWLQQPVKHGRGTNGAAPASDAAGRGDARGMPLPAHPAASRRVMPCGFHFFKADSRRLAPTRLRIGPIRACIGRNRPYRPKPPKRPIQAEIQKKKKKKKGAKRTVWTKS